MKKLDRFILKSFIGPLVAILLVVVFILLLQFLWLYIDELVGKGLGLRVILEFLMWGACTILPQAMPLATLLASMMIVGQMAENNELLAVKAAGVSFSRIIAPLIAASAIIAVGAFFIGDRLVPLAYNKIYTLRDDIGKTKNEIKIPSGTFYDGIDDYILRVNDQDKKSGMLHGVMVYDHTAGKGNVALTIADSALIKMSAGKDYLTFTMFNGSNYQEDNTIRYADTSLTLQRVDFARQDIIVQLSNYKFEKSDSNRFGDQAKAMSAKLLQHQSDSLHHYVDSVQGVHYMSLRRMKPFIESVQLDTATRNPDRADFSYEGFAQWDTPGDKAVAYREASDKASRHASEIGSLKFDTYEQNYYIRHTDIELLKKFAQALACFILFFIGAPLGSLIRKGGLGTSAIISVLFFVLYWVVDISGTKLARDGAIGSFTGAFISAYVLIPIGAFLTWKAINDSELFNLDQFKTWRRKIGSRIASFFRPVRIVYMGTPEFAVAPLDNLIRNKYKVVGVVTVADKPSGRGLKVNESAVKRYAVEHNLPLLQPAKLKDPEFLDALRKWKPDLIVVVAFRMLPEEVWSMPRLGTINLHAALLPQYRGAAPINWAVINGEKLTGVTTFIIDKDIDTGGILMRQECRIEPTDTAGDVHDKLMAIGSNLVLQTVEGLIQHNIETRIQRSFIQGSEVLKPAPKITRETCRIDWNGSSEHIYNLIRGLSPYPAAFTEIAEEGGAPQMLKIYKAEKVDLHGTPGEILSDGKTYLAVATADGAVSIREMQLAGKKRMDVKAFLLGFRNPEKYHIC
jgi:methionyl-tRNA formyltransferase